MDEDEDEELFSELSPINDNEPCLLHLADWNKSTGDEGTVEDLCVRLHQIGRVDIARELARAVYEETTIKIHKYFLDNPFKKTAQQAGSRLMENEKDEDKKTRKETAVDNLRKDGQDGRRFRMAVVALTLTLIFFLCAVMVVYCPASLHTVCPSVCIATFEAIQDSVKERVGTLRTLTTTEGLGMSEVRRPRQPAGPAEKEEQDRLVQSILAI
ncbi:uncharacterized protein [Littorina saxatilis]|uniref:uncharacterized protein n=1 Tax=Littorina saxatilis TaxID=31220 RepID=UPI0038B48D2A